MFNGTSPATDNLKGICGHPTSVPPLTAPVHLNHPVYYWSRRDRDREKERVYVFVLGQKGVLLPQDVAFKAEEVGFLWRKRSQNRQGLVETPCSQHFLSTGHPAAERAARFCGTKPVSPPWEVSVKPWFEFNALTAHAPV